MNMRLAVACTGCLLGILCLSVLSERAPRDFCAFVDMAKAAGQKQGGHDKPMHGFRAGVQVMQGVTLRLCGGGIALRVKEKFAFTPKDLVYAGAKSMDSMTHRDMGPLAFYSIQEVYLLHAVIGNTEDDLVGRIEFVYENNATNTEELVLGENIGSRSVPAEWAEMVTNGFCVTGVLNPVPYDDIRYEPGKGHALKSLGIIISNSDLVYRVVAITCKLGRQKVHD